MGAHIYLVTRFMEDEYFYNADGQILLVPQQGELRLWTEFEPESRADTQAAATPQNVRTFVVCITEFGDFQSEYDCRKRFVFGPELGLSRRQRIAEHAAKQALAPLGSGRDRRTWIGSEQ